MMRSKGLSVAFLGTDGAGKSTVIESFTAMAAKHGFNEFKVLHLRPSLLPPLSRLKGKKTINEGPVTDPHGSTVAGPIGSFLRLNYLMIDYLIGHWIKVRPLLKSKSSLVIFDRYAYDLIIDPVRFRIDIAPRIIKFYAKFVPIPDVIFCLIAPPKTIWERKRELPLGEVERQVELLQKFSSENRFAHVVSTDQSIENTILDIEKILKKVA